MQCELCSKTIEYGQLAVRVARQDGMDPHLPGRLTPVEGGIHLSCLQEITSFVKAMSDTLRPRETTNDEETD